MKNKNIIRVISICFMAVSILLMALPYGVAMTFVSEPGPPMEYVTFYYSYFSGMPLGYGNWFPIITALLSIIVLAVLIIKAARNMNSATGKSVLICLSVCIVASPLSWLVFGAITTLGVIIFAIHVATLVMQIIIKRWSK